MLRKTWNVSLYAYRERSRYLALTLKALSLTQRSYSFLARPFAQSRSCFCSWFPLPFWPSICLFVRNLCLDRGWVLPITERPCDGGYGLSSLLYFRCLHCRFPFLGFCCCEQQKCFHSGLAFCFGMVLSPLWYQIISTLTYEEPDVIIHLLGQRLHTLEASITIQSFQGWWFLWRDWRWTRD